MSTRAEILAYWVKRRAEIDFERASKATKGKKEPSPWVAWTDLEKALQDIVTLDWELEKLSYLSVTRIKELEKQVSDLEKEKQKMARNLGGGF